MTSTGEVSTEERDYADRVKYRSASWKRHFSGDLAYFWPPQLDQPEPDDDGCRWISRDDVFKIAATESQHRELHTAVAAYVWGLGVRNVRAFTTNVGTVEEKLRRAAKIQVAEGTVAAYEAMMPGGVAKTKYMGSAFFTKFLFFIGGRNPAADGLRPLVLDSRVARALRTRGVFGPKVGADSWPSELYQAIPGLLPRAEPERPRGRRGQVVQRGPQCRLIDQPEQHQ